MFKPLFDDSFCISSLNVIISDYVISDPTIVLNSSGAILAVFLILILLIEVLVAGLDWALFKMQGVLCCKWSPNCPIVQHCDPVCLRLDGLNSLLHLMLSVML